MDDTNSDASSLKGKKLTRLLSRRSKRGKTASSTKSAKSHQPDSDTNSSGVPDMPWREFGQANAGDYAGYPSAPSTPGESLVTSDSDEENSQRHPSSPPPLVNRPSHSGYLVATSPRVQATALADLALESSHSTSQIKHHSSTFPTQPSDHPRKLDAGFQHASTMSGTLGVDQSSASRSSSRSISPGSRFKDAFRKGSRKSSPSKDGTNDSERHSRPSTRDGDRPQSQPVPKHATAGSTASLPISLTYDRMDDASIPPVPPLPSTPQIAINGTGLGSKRSLNSIIINSGTPKTPETTVTPPTPVVSVDGSTPATPATPSFTRQSPKLSSSPISPTPNVSSHRRTRSDSSTKNPSKLSLSMTQPLTPTQEEPSGPVRGRNTNNAPSGGGGGGFFSSMFNAAQNMTTNFTVMGGNNRPRTGTSGSAPASIPEEKEEAEAQATHNGEGEKSGLGEPPKELAIETLGSGNLSLSHLGIVADSPQSLSSPQNGGQRSRSGTQVKHEEAQAQAEDAYAAKAISAAYDNAPSPLDRPATAVAEDTASTDLTRPQSFYEGSINAKTPPNGSVYEEDPNGSSILRSGSIREKLVDRKKRKHRNSSSTTIGAAITASHAATSSPGRRSITQKLDGFVYANKKRDKDYHQLFRSVPEDDHLLEDYSCALQRDIILAGRIYVSEGHICFSSNILGWVTTLVISFDEIVAVDKESTAMVFPNAIAIQTLHARHTFRSLLSREVTYDLIVGIWKTNHPNLQSTETGTKLLSAADAAAAAASRAEGEGSEVDLSDEDDDSEGEDDDDEDEDDADGTDSLPSKSGSINQTDLAVQSSPTRRVSAMAQDAGAITAAPALAAQTGTTAAAAVAAGTAVGAAPTAEKDYPGPATHAPTECTDAASHYDNILKDDVVAAPLGKVYNMVFGPASAKFMSAWLQDVAKCWDIEVADGGTLKALDSDNKSRSFTYMKPLNAPIGPKQTKCVVTEQLDAFDLDRAVSVTVTTQTPDVPSGNVFSTKTRYCFSWASNNSTKVHMSYFIEWTGKSWIKGPIEKGAKDGQGTYAEDLVKSLRQGATAGARGRAGSKTKKGKKKKGGDGTRGGGDGGSSGKPKGGRKEEPNWGLLEPLRPLLGPFVEPIAPLFSPTMMIGFLIFLLIVTWFRNSRLRTVMREADANAMSAGGYGPLSRLQSGGHHGFEQTWRTEEEALWNWLEERVGLRDGVPEGFSGKKGHAEKSNADSSREARKDRQKILGSALRSAGADLVGMSKREVEYALRVTEEKLEALKRMVEKPDGSSET